MGSTSLPLLSSKLANPTVLEISPVHLMQTPVGAVQYVWKSDPAHRLGVRFRILLVS